MVNKKDPADLFDSILAGIEELNDRMDTIEERIKDIKPGTQVRYVKEDSSGRYVEIDPINRGSSYYKDPYDYRYTPNLISPSSLKNMISSASV